MIFDVWPKHEEAQDFREKCRPWSKHKLLIPGENGCQNMNQIEQQLNQMWGLKLVRTF